MWLEAILSLEDLRRAVGQLLPATLELGGGATLALGDPTEVSLLPNDGLRIACPAEVTWPVLGIAVPIKVLSVSFVISPRLKKTNGAEALTFEPRIEHADFAHLPNMVDNRLTDLINKELAKHGPDLTWRFAQTLRNTIDLPEVLRPLRSLAMRAHGAMVRVTDEALVLALSLHVDITSRKPALAAQTADDHG